MHWMCTCTSCILYLKPFTCKSSIQLHCIGCIVVSFQGWRDCAKGGRMPPAPPLNEALTVLASYPWRHLGGGGGGGGMPGLHCLHMCLIVTEFCGDRHTHLFMFVYSWRHERKFWRGCVRTKCRVLALWRTGEARFPGLLLNLNKNIHIGAQSLTTISYCCTGCPIKQHGKLVSQHCLLCINGTY